MNHLFSMKTPAGVLVVEDNGEAIVSVRFDNSRIISPVTSLQKEAEKEIREYFEGVRKSFDLPVDMEGTAFQKKVWNALRTIPYGKTVSYQKLAEMCGNQKACRAVGMAVHHNPLLLLIPCHRVILKDGSIGGYAGGTERKQFLLNLEKEHA